MQTTKSESSLEQEYSFRIESEAQLLEAFGERDQKRVLLPLGASYPIHVRHYYAWRDPSGVYVYMVFKRPEWKAPIGLVFKRSHPGSHLSNARLCDWCLSYGPSDLVGMLSLSLNPRQSIGLMLCLDLGCAERLEDVADRSGKNFEKLIEQLYARISRLYETVLRERQNPNAENPGIEDLH